MLFGNRRIRQQELIFLSGDGRYGLVLRRKRWRAMLSRARSNAPSEAGGALVGHYTDDLRFAVVTRVICLENRAQPRQPKRFVRDGASLSSFLLRAWRKTCGGEYYLGEWHSHPAGPPEPSGRDRREMEAIASEPEEKCRAPVLVLLGNTFGQVPHDISAFVFPRGESPQRMVFLDDS